MTAGKKDIPIVKVEVMYKVTIDNAYVEYQGTDVVELCLDEGQVRELWQKCAEALGEY